MNRARLHWQDGVAEALRTIRGHRMRSLLLILGALVALGGFFWLDGKFESSLPWLEGKTRLAGLSAEVRVERDAKPGMKHVTSE